MKPIVFIQLLIIFIAASDICYSQNDSLLSPTNEVESPIDCEIITSKAIEMLTKYDSIINITEIENFGTIMDNWIQECGYTEVIMRLILLDAMTKGDSTNDLIKYYIENEFDNTLKNRQWDSKRPDYGVYYASNKTYYGFVPINHRIDTILYKNFKMLADSGDLTRDEKLICLLFTGQNAQYKKEIKNPRYKSSFIKKYTYQQEFEDNDSDLTYSLVTGAYTPLASGSTVFSVSPIIGITINTPLKYKFSLEFDLKFRININDKNFRFYALGDTSTVNSDLSYFIGALGGYKLYEKNNYKIICKIGAGLETVSTGIVLDGDEDKEYFDVETLHLTSGIIFMRPIFYGKYLGIGLNYHYTPYNLEEDLYTKFYDHSFSCEVSMFF